MSLKHCKVCGTSYSYCPSCTKDADKPAWMVSFDKIECKRIFDALAANGVGVASDEDTLRKLTAMNYKKVVITNQGVKAHIARLEKTSRESNNNKAEMAVDVKTNAKEATKVENDNSDVKKNVEKEADDKVVKEAPKENVEPKKEAKHSIPFSPFIGHSAKDNNVIN